MYDPLPGKAGDIDILNRERFLELLCNGGIIT
jgi:hypothetical protein